MTSSQNIESVLKENRVFAPSAAFSEKAHVRSAAERQAMSDEAAADPEAFWAKIASDLHWFQPWTKVLDWQPPFAKWFVGATTNITYNCIDRHVQSARRNKAAILWEGEPGDSRVLTYADLLREVSRFANVLDSLGVVKGDRVGLYMPMIPELAIAMLACARIGATHSVVFGGFSAEALRDRMNDAQARVVVTADGGYRRGGVVPLKVNVDAALAEVPSVQSVVVVRRTGSEVDMRAGRDHWWDELMSAAGDVRAAEPLDAEHPLFILYTSGTTGKPKGVVHTTGGYMVHTAATSRWVFDLKEDDTYFCTADIGWITGHSYVIYGILANGATTVMYEGAPNHPQPDRFWQLIDKYGVSIFYTAPTAIRSFVKWGSEWPRKHRLDRLRLLGTVGEPINPEAWMWYHNEIGHGRCPIVDTWWQTETGGILLTPFPGATPTKPGSATLPIPGLAIEVVTREGVKVGPNQGGFLVIRKPWPGMMRTIYGDPERFKQQYWSQIEGAYFTGDGARQDEDGYFWVMGRIDDVVNVSGHRLGTMEVESALVSHPAVAEAAVVGRPDEITGQAIEAFVSLEAGYSGSDDLAVQLRAHVAKEIGAFAKPAKIRFADALPKTRSGKIMRRLLRDIASGSESVGDTTTLEDLSVLAKLRNEEE
jgi:acetyl-CoA synthetase